MNSNAVVDNNQYPHKDKFEAKKEVFEWVEALVFSIVIVVLIFTFLFRVVGVDGRSMEPTLYDGDRLLISNMMYRPKAFDIVVLTDQTSQNKPIIKRIIATEGQTVNIDYSNGDVIVDDKILVEDYVSGPTATRGDVVFPVVVPKDKVFVLGDNRGNSLDSRYSDIGMANISDILGRAFFRIYPFNSIGGL